MKAIFAMSPIFNSMTRVFLLVVAIKIVLVFVVLPNISGLASSTYTIDRFSDGYHMLAVSLAEGYGYRFFPETSPTLMREPGYPLFLALLFSIFGYSLTVVKIANFILSFVAAYIIIIICRKIAPGRKSVELIAPCLFLLHPGVIIAESRGGVEILLVVFLVLLHVFLYRSIESNKVYNYLISGLILGVAVLIKGTLAIFPIFFFAYLLIVERGRISAWLAARNVCVVILAMCMVMSPWVIRNYSVSGRFVPTAGIFGVAAFTGEYICKNLTFNNRMMEVDAMAARALNERAKMDGYRFKGEYYRYFYSTTDEVDFNSKIWEEVKSDYVNDPALFMQCATQNVFKFWFAGKSWTATVLNMLVQLPYIVLALIGVVVSLRKNEGRVVGPLILFVIYYMAVHVAVHAQARHSIPTIPMLSILAAIPLSSLLRRKYI